MEKPSNHYGDILRSSSIMGGAQAFQYLAGILRTKVIAVLLGPTGVGLIGLYIAVTTFVGTVAGLGLASSGVRDLAEAHAAGDEPRFASTARTLRLLSVLSGVVGWVLLAAFSSSLSEWTFGTSQQSSSLTLLGGTVVLATLEAAESAVLQGSRRIGDLARRSALSVAFSTISAIALYFWLGEQGIVPALVATSAINFAVAAWYARRVALRRISPRSSEVREISKRLLQLGLAFMWSAVLAALAGLAIRALIVRDFGVEGNGIHQAAWGLSGMFAAFLLAAMGADFYPRLTAAAHDHSEMNGLVNQQTEVGMLLALPGLLGTLAFAPWVMRLFYSSDFESGTELLPWFVLGVFGRVVSWPLGYVLLAKGSSRWFVATETAATVLHVALSFVLMRWLGLWGVALAFAVLYGAHVLGMRLLCAQLTGFRWSASASRLLIVATVLALGSFATARWLPQLPAMVLGAALTLLASVLSIRGITSRVGAGHRLVRLFCRFPGGKYVCGVV